MTRDHLQALLNAAEASEGKDGWMELGAGRSLNLYAASNGVGLTVSRVSSLRVEPQWVTAKTARGELYVVALEDLFAGAVEAPAQGARKTGFV